MELVLNLAWIVLAALMYLLWIRCAPQKGADRRTQILALALVILILFPVISVTDDLMTAQNPAETESCQRKGHVLANLHPTLHPLAGLILLSLADLSTDSFHIAVADDSRNPIVDIPALDSIQNRPPPAA